MTDRHLLLIDASGFAHRAYHAGGAQFRSDGLPTWAVTGFLGMMWRLLGAAGHDTPTHAVAAFDAPGKTFRHVMFPAYKTNRPARDQELTAQMPYMRIAAQAMGIAPVEAEGFEADDVIATLATRAIANGIRTTIVSSDKDLCQLVRDGWIEIVDPVSGNRLMSEDVRDHKFGVHPHQVIEYQALAGDAVDNIPGIDGIGHKSAAALIRIFGTVEGVIEGAENGSAAFTPSQRVALRGKLKDLRLYRELARLRTDVPIEQDMDFFALQPIERSVVFKLLDTLEARGRFEAIFATAPKLDRFVLRLADDEEIFGWWCEELLAPGQEQPDEPQCGWYLGRLVKGGPLVPARIWREPGVDPISGAAMDHDVLRCVVAGRPRDAVQWWPKLAKNPISVADYEFEMADAEWTRNHAPTDPKASPDRKIDPVTAPIPVFKPARKKANGHKSPRRIGRKLSPGHAAERG